jgi:hypothetical protein
MNTNNESGIDKYLSMNTNNINYLIPNGARAGIYLITAPDGHYYIGSTNNFRKRIKEHFKELKKSTKQNSLWQNKYNAHPNWVWNCELLEVVTCTSEISDEDFSELLLSKEQAHLDFHHGLPLCMNVSKNARKPPSGKGRLITMETRIKLSNALKGKKKSKRSKEHIEKLAAARRKVPMSDTTRAKLSAMWKGIPKSAETINKMSLAQMGKILTEEHKHKLRQAKLGKPWSEARRLAITGKPWSEARRLAYENSKSKT